LEFRTIPLGFREPNPLATGGGGIALGDLAVHGLFGVQSYLDCFFENIQGDVSRDVKIFPLVLVVTLWDAGGCRDLHVFSVCLDPDEVAGAGLPTVLNHVVDNVPQFPGVGDGAAHLAQFPDLLFSSDPLVLGFEGQLGGDSAELTIPVISGFLGVEVLLRAVAKEFQIGTGEEIVQDFFRFVCGEVAFTHLLPLGGLVVDGTGYLGGQCVLVDDGDRSQVEVEQDGGLLGLDYLLFDFSYQNFFVG
jgi:hypothetical protein